MSGHIRTFAIFLLIGTLWGLTTPLMKVAVSGDYRHFGIIFWQFTVSVTVLGLFNILRRKPLPLGIPALRLYVVIAFIGTLLPNWASYEAARHLPAGIMALVISTVPMFAYPIAIGLGLERPQALRFAGIAIGFAGVGLITLPGTDLGATLPVAFIAIALVAPAFYAIEANFIAANGSGSCDAIQTLLGAALFGIPIAALFAFASGTFFVPSLPLTGPSLAVLAIGFLHALAYTGYLYLVRIAGSVFSTQVGYVVTATGILWAMVLLNEKHTATIWLALALIFLGIFLVSPKENHSALEADDPSDAH